MKQKSIIVAIIALLSLTATSMKGFAQNNDGLDPELAQYLTVQHFEGDFSMAQLEQDAQSGNADAQCFLGMCYMMGVNTVPDFKKAFEWLEKAANQDYQLALALMGMFYYQGGEEMG
jgi:TPR repeat protein